MRLSANYLHRPAVWILVCCVELYALSFIEQRDFCKLICSWAASAFMRIYKEKKKKKNKIFENLEKSNHLIFSRQNTKNWSNSSWYFHCTSCAYLTIKLVIFFLLNRLKFIFFFTKSVSYFYLLSIEYLLESKYISLQLWCHRNLH